MATDARYAFIVDWYDATACMVRQYQLMYYCADGTIEMFDLKNRRTFLKRCDYPGVRLADLYEGSIITVYSRQLTIVKYGDTFTARAFQKQTEMTVAYVMSDAVSLVGQALDMASSLSLAIVELRMLGLSPSHASAIFADPAVAAAASKGLLVAAKLSGQDAVAKWSGAIAGQAGVSGSASGAAAAKEAEALFGGAIPPTSSPSEFESSSLLLVRPHAVREGKLGAILHQVMASGFAVRGLQMLQLSRPNAVEFLEVYKGVVPEYSDWVEEVVSGKCVAVQVVYSAQKEMSVPALRELCGAHDPEIASHLHKGSLRALYGDDKVKNAVHCTDLPDDAPLELDYFFCLLPSAA